MLVISYHGLTSTATTSAKDPGFMQPAFPEKPIIFAGVIVADNSRSLALKSPYFCVNSSASFYDYCYRFRHPCQQQPAFQCTHQPSSCRARWRWFRGESPSWSHLSHRHGRLKCALYYLPLWNGSYLQCSRSVISNLVKHFFPHFIEKIDSNQLVY